MARIARVVAPGLPHHVTQRGNRRQQTFFCDDDYRAYLELMAQWCSRCAVEIWAYCLMPNHVHLIAVPESKDGLRSAIGEAHRRYTRRINFREGWRGHLWQGRFASYTMEERYLLAAARYIEMNPQCAPGSLIALESIPGAARPRTLLDATIGLSRYLLCWSSSMIGGSLLANKSQSETSVSSADTSAQADPWVVRGLSTG